MIYNCFVGFIQICKGFFDEKVVSLSTKEYNSAVRSNIRQMINSNLLFWTSFILFENSVKAFRSIKHSYCTFSCLFTNNWYFDSWGSLAYRYILSRILIFWECWWGTLALIKINLSSTLCLFFTFWWLLGSFFLNYFFVCTSCNFAAKFFCYHYNVKHFDKLLQLICHVPDF